MITKWKLFNFKSVEKETDLAFSPLTIFAGVNSSGKSSVLQSILLISQTLAHKVGSRSVVLNGALTQLGQFDDLRSVGSAADQIGIGWECRPAIQLQHTPLTAGLEAPGATLIFGTSTDDIINEVGCEIFFDTHPVGAERELSQLRPQLFSTNLSVLGPTPDGQDARASLTVTRSAARPLAEMHGKLEFNDADEIVRSTLNYDITLDDKSLMELHEEWPTAKLVGCALRHFLPDDLFTRVDWDAEHARDIHSALTTATVRSNRRPRPGSRKGELTPRILLVLREILGERLDRLIGAGGVQLDLFGEPVGRHVSLAEWSEHLEGASPDDRNALRQMLTETSDLSARIADALRQDSSKPQSREIVRLQPPRKLSHGMRYMERFFSVAVKYLGPLRDDPKPLYPLAAGADPTDVGLRGELTAAVLDLHKHRKVRYIPSSAFKPHLLERTVQTRSLEAAVVDWLQYLGVAEEARSIDRGKLGHEFKVRLAAEGPEHDLTHVGVGVSQVLPILVMCLLAEPDTTLIFEQPELHLHPKVQTRLADFFLSIVLNGKQCLIETHSEYLINRLRLRAATEGADNRVTTNLKMYFVEKEEGCSQFREVEVNEYGAILKWPDGFFDQSQEESEQILRAAALKRKARKEGNRDA